jgi:hypothetical protein
MIALISSTLLSFFLFTTFGYFVTGKLQIRSNFVEIILLGLVTCNTLVSIISLFSAINIIIVCVFFIVGLIIFYINKNVLILLFSRLYASKSLLFCSLFFIVIGFFLALSSPENYDTDLYHLQTIKWIEKFPAVPGLANLHGRFGFNPNIFTLFSLTSLNDIFNQEIFSINFLVFSILIYYYIKTLHSIYIKEGISNIFFFFLFIFLIILRLKNLSSPSPDYLSTVIPLYIFSRLIQFSMNNEKNVINRSIPILVLSVYVLTVKLAALPILLIFLFLIFHYKVSRKYFLWLISLFLVILLPWIVRNVVITGWLVYPMPFLDLFNFDWKVPIESVINEKFSVTGWARNRGDNHIFAAKMSILDWLPIWWHSLIFIYRLFFILSLTLPSLIIVLQILRKIQLNLLLNAVIITSFMGVLFWLFLAPTWRFGESFILVASMSPLLVFKKSILNSNSIMIFLNLILLLTLGYYTMNKYFIVMFFIFGLIFLNYYYNLSISPKIGFPLVLFLFFSTYIKRNINSVKSNLSFFIVPKSSQIPSKLTFSTFEISGVDIYVPNESDRCYNLDLPCTPYPDSTLVLRTTNLKGGFKHLVDTK